MSRPSTGSRTERESAVGADTATRAAAGRCSARARAFSLIEILVIVLVLGAIAAFAAPQFAGATEDERTGRAENVIAGVRDAIDSFARRAEAQNAPPYPSYNELITPGVVLRDAIPANPFNGSSRVQIVSRPQADQRAVVNAGSAGWNYYVDNSIDPPRVLFYANSTNTTTAPSGQGTTLKANEL